MKKEEKNIMNLNWCINLNLDYDNDFYNSGAFWFAQGHVFWAPFYYIDYTLAQVCAFQYLLKYLENKEETLKEYITLCKAGGSESFFNY